MPPKKKHKPDPINFYDHPDMLSPEELTGILSILKLMGRLDNVHPLNHITDILTGHTPVKLPVNLTDSFTRPKHPFVIQGGEYPASNKP